MSGDNATPATGSDPAEDALAEVEQLAESQDENHEARLGALEKLHAQLESELDERDPGARPSQ